MSSSNAFSLPKLLILGAIYVLFRLVRFGSRGRHLPPGPTTHPIIGNAHLVIDKNLYRRYLPLRHDVWFAEGRLQIQGVESTIWRSVLSENRKRNNDSVEQQARCTWADRQTKCNLFCQTTWWPISHGVERWKHCQYGRRRYLENPEEDHFTILCPSKIGWWSRESIRSWVCIDKHETWYSTLQDWSVQRVAVLLHDLLNNPQDYRKHIDRATASFSSIALFGQRASSINDFWATVSNQRIPP